MKYRDAESESSEHGNICKVYYSGFIFVFVTRME